MDGADAPKKAHRKSKSGAKAEKKANHQMKKKGEDPEAMKKRNPKVLPPGIVFMLYLLILFSRLSLLMLQTNSPVLLKGI